MRTVEITMTFMLPTTVKMTVEVPEPEDIEGDLTSDDCDIVAVERAPIQDGLTERSITEQMQEADFQAFEEDAVRAAVSGTPPAME